MQVSWPSATLVVWLRLHELSDGFIVCVWDEQKSKEVNVFTSYTAPNLPLLPPHAVFRKEGIVPWKRQ